MDRLAAPVESLFPFSQGAEAFCIVVLVHVWHDAGDLIHAHLQAVPRRTLLELLQLFKHSLTVSDELLLSFQLCLGFDVLQ